MITISGTPKWANGDKTPNVPPTKMSDLTTFAQMLSARYNGLHAGFGSVSRYTVWNEPNLEQFLKPQFDGKKIVSPEIYAKLYMAAYKGIKAGNPLADVAIGSTSNRGRNKPTDKSGTVAPATFARLLAEADPNLPFVAWATHPYPTTPNLGPRARAAYPAVTMTRIDQFGKDLDKWFHRRVPIWITEYAEQTKPEYAGGVSRAQQATDVKTALEMAAASPYVEMFVWFILKDSTDKTWNSGLIARSGIKKPSYAVFAKAAKGIDGQAQMVAANKSPTIRLDIPFLTYGNAVGARVGITYEVLEGKKSVAVGQPVGTIAADQTVSFLAKFKPVKGKTYILNATVGDKHGQITKRSVSLTVT
jgi:hypothetical protein